MSRTAETQARWPRTWLAPLVALLIAAIVGDILILSFGQSPREVYRLLIEGTWGNAYGIGQVLYKATTLTFTGLAVALGLRAGLFNIGAEGQLAAGGFAAAMAGLLLPAGTPALIAVPLCVWRPALGGGAGRRSTGSAQGALRRQRSDRHHHAQLRGAGVPQLDRRDEAARRRVAAHAADQRRCCCRVFPTSRPRSMAPRPTPRSFSPSLTAAAVGWYLFRTRAGYDLRAVGLQPDAAEYGGVSVGTRPLPRA